METITIQIVAMFISVLGSIISGVVLIAINRTNKKNDMQEKSRKEECVLILQSLTAIGELAEQSARCIRGEMPNGELTQALEYHTNIKRDLYAHLCKVSAEIQRST